MGPTVVPETSSTKLTCTPCKTRKPKYQYSSQSESLKSRMFQQCCHKGDCLLNRLYSEQWMIIILWLTPLMDLVTKNNHNISADYMLGLNWSRTFNWLTLFPGAFAELRKATISFVTSVCPHETTRLPLDKFWWNFMFETFSKICWENPTKITGTLHEDVSTFLTISR
jgi:hypothetical protein